MLAALGYFLFHAAAAAADVAAAGDSVAGGEAFVVAVHDGNHLCSSLVQLSIEVLLVLISCTSLAACWNSEGCAAGDDVVLKEDGSELKVGAPVCRKVSCGICFLVSWCEDVDHSPAGESKVQIRSLEVSQVKCWVHTKLLVLT